VRVRFLQHEDVWIPQFVPIDSPDPVAVETPPKAAATDPDELERAVRAVLADEHHMLVDLGAPAQQAEPSSTARLAASCESAAADSVDDIAAPQSGIAARVESADAKGTPLPLPLSRPIQAHGRFRRMIDLRRADDHVAWGWIEDDFHHFGVRIEHAAGMITVVRAATKRAPWSTCSAAGLALQGMVGQALRPRASDIGAMIDMRIQCTHMFDLAGLVMAHACSGRERRTYEVEVPDRQPGFEGGRAVQRGANTVRLLRDSAPIMRWDIEDGRIVSPQSYAGHSLNTGFRAWTETLPEEEAEQAFVLRRAIMVSNGRFVELDRMQTAAENPLPPVCHTFRGDLTQALRNKGENRDHSQSSEGMLAFRDVSP